MKIKIKKRGRSHWHIVEPKFMCKHAADLDIARHERIGYMDDDDGDIYLPEPFENTYIIKLGDICLRCRQQALSQAKMKRANQLRGEILL